MDASGLEPYRGNDVEPEFYVKAVFEFTGDDPCELSFTEGDVIAILEQLYDSGWVVARHEDGRVGYMPLAYVEEIPEDEGMLTLTAFTGWHSCKVSLLTAP